MAKASLVPLAAALVALALAPVTRAAAAQKKAKPPAAAAAELVPFVGELELARQAARERNVPLAYLLALEGEEANDRFQAACFGSRELAQASAGALIVFANNGLHDSETVVELVDGKPLEKKRCARFRTPSCTDHQRAWDQIYATYFNEQDMRTPAVVVLAPAGGLFQTISTGDVPPMGRIVATLDAAQKAAGPPLSQADLNSVRVLLGPAREHARAGRWIEAWQSWRAIAALAPGGLYGDEARAGQTVASQAVRKRVAELEALLAPGTAADAWEELTTLLASAQGLEIERDLKRITATAERRADLRAEIDLRKAEHEAREMWDEAREALRAGEERRAERLVRKMLSTPRLSGTAAAGEARAAHPGWVGE